MSTASEHDSERAPDSDQPAAALRGMTWDHPRAYQPLAAFDAQTRADLAAGGLAGGGLAGGDTTRTAVPQVAWDRQALADFEAHPIGDLAQRYDLMIVDHPGLGAAVQQQALLPLDEVFGPDELAAWASRTVGRTWQSYRYQGHQWALPIDAATQVTVLRPDLIGRPPPARWQDVARLAREVPITLCLGGPHAFLSLLAICASARSGTAAGGTALPNTTLPVTTTLQDTTTLPDPLLDIETATEAIVLLRELWRLGDQETSLLDPIGVHAALAASPDLAFCPLAYGYASYAEPGPGDAALAWAPAPGWRDGAPGSVLGGTGLAVSRHSAHRLDDVRGYVRAFLADDVQSSLVPDHGGQPAHRGAWDSPAVDARWGGYYSATRSSLESAWIRPRRPGWIAFQDHASDLVRECVTSGVTSGASSSARALAEQLNRDFAQNVAQNVAQNLVKEHA